MAHCERPLVSRGATCLNTGGSNIPEFAASHLVWTVPRTERAFAIKVVEPARYEPDSHGHIFAEVLIELISPRAVIEDGFEQPRQQSPSRFDLITFPEAFVPPTHLLESMRSLSRVMDLGCIHVGLRPSGASRGHLFGLGELQQLTADILALPTIEPGDLAPFKSWLDAQDASAMMNIGCVFTVDVNGRLRVCLHPKVVRSQVESSPLPEEHMWEADLLTLITLKPRNKLLLSVTLQPLICSDALNLQTDRGTGSPIVEVNRQPNIFDDLPDHIDLVSVATCTPQVIGITSQEMTYREWHQEFRSTFNRASEDGTMTRHHFATFVLSNFHTLPHDAPGGLSGIFQPVDPKRHRLHDAVRISCFGEHESGGNNRWTTPDDEPLMGWRKRGFIAALDPYAEGQPSAVKIFGFRLPNMLRDRSPWHSQKNLTRCEVMSGRWETSGALAFSKAGDPE